MTTTGVIVTEFNVELQGAERRNICSNGPVVILNMIVMFIYGYRFVKVFFSGTDGPTQRAHDVKMTSY